MSGTTTYFGITYPTNTDYVKDGASAMQTIATGFDSAVAIPTYNNQTGTTYTFVLADTPKVVTSNNASAVTFTVPPQSSVAWATGATLQVKNLGAGAVTFAGGVGVTITNTATTVPQYGEATLVRTGSDAWTVVATVAASPGLTLIKTQVVGSAVSSVSVSDAFSATYDNYYIVYTGGSATSIADLRLSLNGITTGYYHSASFVNYSTSGVSGGGLNNGSYWPWAGTCNNPSGIIFNCEVTNPYLSLPKYTKSNLTNNSSSGFASGYNTSTSSATGFTLTPASGTITGGTIRVYGYKL